MSRDMPSALPVNQIQVSPRAALAGTAAASRAWRHRARYFSRRRWRITSATVLTTKVMVKSRAAARKRTR